MLSGLRTRPWLAYLALFALFCILGPYDLNNRADKEGQNEDLKTTLAGQNAGIEEGHAIRRVAVVGLAIVALAILGRSRRARRLHIAPPQTPVWDPYPVLGGRGDPTVAIPIVAFVLFSIASIFWGTDAALIARRLFVFLTLCYAAWAVGRTWRLSDILLFMILACSVTLLASIAIEIKNGAFHPIDPAYRLAGLAHPNRHAQEASVIVIACLAMYRIDPEDRKRYFLTACAAAVVILLARSRTSMVSLAFALGCAALYTMPRRKVLGAGIVLTTLVLAVGVFGQELLDSAKHALLLGRQASTADINSLSGRTDLWRELFTYVAVRPVGGYGFQAFWDPQHTANVSLTLGWIVPTAHNGYLDVLLMVGVIGLVLFVAVIVASLAHAMRQLKTKPINTEALCAFTFIVFIATTLMSESVLPETHYSAFLAMILLARQTLMSPVPVRVKTVRAYMTPAASLTV